MTLENRIYSPLAQSGEHSFYEAGVARSKLAGATRQSSSNTSKGINMNTKQRILSILLDQLGLDESKVQEESALVSDLGADSLDLVEICMAMEEDFDIEIPDEDVENAKTVKQLIEVADRLSKK